MRGPACCAAVAVLVASVGTAQAQLGGSVGIDSDYRFRGVSLSGSHPDLRLSVAYDVASGWYAGASGSGAVSAGGRRYQQVVGYLGYVKRGAQGLSWEVGSTASHFSGDARHDYGEAYAGLIAERWNLRVYYSPDYFGRGVQTVYAELNGSLALHPPLRLFSHVGALAVVAGSSAYRADSASRLRADARLGIGIAFDPVDLQFAWVGASRGGPRPGVYPAPHGVWLLSASYSF